MKTLRNLTLALTCGLAVACQDLTVDDQNQPTLEESLNTVANVEISVGSATKYWLGGVVMGSSINQALGTGGSGTFSAAIDGLNDAMTFGIRSTDLPPTTVLDEPRTIVQHSQSNFGVNKAPYQDAYSALATCHALRLKVAGGFTWANSARATYYCKLLMGFTHLYLGVLFDKALIVQDDGKPIDVFNQDFRPHDEVVELAKKQIREGIDEAKAAPTSSTPTSWINGVAYTNVDMAKIAYGYLARAEVWKAATPAQREDKSKGGVVDWAKVIQYVDSSLTSTWTVGSAPAAFPTNNITGGTTAPSFTVDGDQNIATARNASLFNLMLTTAGNSYRFHHKFLGPGDTSGAYATYLSTPIGSRTDTNYASPDKRMPLRHCPPTGALCARHVSTTTSANWVELPLPGDGKYFQLLANTGTGNFGMTANNRPTDGYRLASYQFIRFGATDAARRSNNTGRWIVYNDYQPLMTPEELRLLKAEAYMRLGQPALAVPLINISRTDANKGALPPVGINGPTQSFPQCVPHAFKDARLCGDLWDALLWEKRLEAIGTDMYVNFADWRAFGYLEPGSWVYFPPSSRETETMGLPYYTYGPSLPGSAGVPCPATSTEFQYIGCTNYTPVLRQPRPPGG